FSDFKKLDIRIGKILSAEKAEGTDKLMKLQVDFGSEKRQIVAGIAEFYEPEDLIGKECPFLFNLEPKSLKGHESQGMILAVDVEGDRSDCILLHPNKETKPGAKVV
ncbi:MAG: methionine--tRNA ligase subunit beta, partial [Candidatus Aenigmarchaeota archaeon]|nr:methionine--tRNA ligase subunit beta [Candidatus Aenigmarchaeota archaeon]